MPATDSRIDAYIAKAAPFAQPILRHLRDIVHTAIPSIVEEIKWGMPYFTLNGSIVAAMASFKAHASFMIHGDEEGWEKEGMGAFGKLAALADLPSDSVLQAKLAAAADRVGKFGTAAPKEKASAPRPLPDMPDDLAAALQGNPAAKATLERFPPSAQREYLEWIVEAKQAATRAKRIGQAVEWLAEGKKRHWKYEKC